MSLRILSYNMHRGFSATSRKYVLEEIRTQFQILAPELIFLQEVLGDHSHHSELIPADMVVSQIDYLADTVWSHNAYGKNRSFASGHMGNAILSKYPILSSTNLDVSTNRFERRGVLHVTIDWPGYSAPLHCICVHLNLTARGRKIQLQQLCDKVSSEVPADEPLIIAGDFNDWAVSASKVLSDSLGVHEVFKKLQGKYAGTYPAKVPLLRLDRIYCRYFDAKQLAVHSKGPWKNLSDHAAVSAELDLNL
jgi:endonuclease/exonuclease/phosphatase family metal-dependent hydrolase